MTLMFGMHQLQATDMQKLLQYHQVESQLVERNVSIEFTVIVRTTKILMVKFCSTFSLAASEVEFFQQCKNSKSVILVYIHK